MTGDISVRKKLKFEHRITSKMATVIRQPGLRSQTSGTSGSVQYIGGYDGPYAGEEDVLLQEKKARPNEMPIPMGLEVFQGVSKLVAHQVVGEDEGIVEYADCAIVLFC